ncbi:30S ribosomal protein S9 [Mucisphaera sp.]|uniref:30S ribosomal protein S9 n=1 Tax=Mucisphaera sp. TaxID=2913024 RepID=UPI003D0E37B1
MSSEEQPLNAPEVPEVPSVPEVPGVPVVPTAEAPQQQVKLSQPATPDAGGFVWGTGRRKASIARVRIRPGTGTMLVNNRQVDEYFSEPQHRNACTAPLNATDAKDIDVFVSVHGGGITGQADAILLGVARALKGYDPSMEAVLRENNFLSRDPRKVERKKYGQRGARRKFQFSKR